MDGDFEEAKRALLKALAKKYIWWEPPDAAAQNERRVVAQIMNIGDFDDVRRALTAFGVKPFEDALTHADPGWFSAKSWAYWHYRCRIVPFEKDPPALPTRKIHR
jgi:hypothetical protein